MLDENRYIDENWCIGENWEGQELYNSTVPVAIVVLVYEGSK